MISLLTQTKKLITPTLSVDTTKEPNRLVGFFVYLLLHRFGDAGGSGAEDDVDDDFGDHIG